MVKAYHVILCMYGFWLPNDPRGSYSDFVWADDLRKFGPATKVNTRQSVASKSHDVRKRLRAKKALKYPPVHLDEQQIKAIGAGIAKAAEIQHAGILACAIMPEHIHLVVARGEGTIEEVVAEVKQRATLKLGEERIHPMEEHCEPSGRRHSPWARGFWVVYLNDEPHIENAMRYTAHNPEKEGRPRQFWDFVVPYEQTV
ncbi:MAG: transposase [Planctomycetaceae bacterium]